MTQFIKLIIWFISELVLLLDSVTFDLFGYEVSYMSVIIVFLIMGFVINVFWKGARA